MPSRFYHHSGKMPPRAMFLAPVLSLSFAAITGSLFGYFEFLTHLLPGVEIFVIVLGVALLGSSVVLAVVPVWLHKRLKARSTAGLLFLTFSQSCVALYFAWVFWIVAYLNYFSAPIRLRIAYPSVLWHSILTFYRHGVWGTVFGVHPVGNLLAAIWLTEAAIVIVVPIALAKKYAVENVFCEHCNKWGVIRSLMQTSAINSEKLRTTILAGDFDLIKNAEPSPPGEDCWNDFTLEGCDTCDALQTLTVTRTIRLRSERKTELERKRLIHRLLITPEQTATLAQIAATVMSTPPSAPE